MTIKEKARNVFSKREDFEYQVPPVGIHVMGLMSIKNVTIKNTFGGGDSESPGYQLIFRSRENPKEFVNFKATAGISDRSNLGKALKKMTRARFNSFKDLSPEEAYELLMACENKWFEVSVKHSPWRNKEGEEIIFAKVDDNDIRAVQVPGSAPDEFFNGSAAQSAPVRKDPAWTTDAPKKETTSGVVVEGVKSIPLEDDDIPWG